MDRLFEQSTLFIFLLALSALMGASDSSARRIFFPGFGYDIIPFKRIWTSEQAGEIRRRVFVDPGELLLEDLDRYTDRERQLSFLRSNSMISFRKGDTLNERRPHSAEQLIEDLLDSSPFPSFFESVEIDPVIEFLRRGYEETRRHFRQIYYSDIVIRNEYVHGFPRGHSHYREPGFSFANAPLGYPPQVLADGSRKRPLGFVRNRNWEEPKPNEILMLDDAWHRTHPKAGTSPRILLISDHFGFPYD